MRLFFLSFFTLVLLNGFSQSAWPDSVALVNVISVNKQNQPRPNERIFLKSYKTGRVYTDTTDANGRFIMFLPKEDTFHVTYDNFGDTVHYGEQIIQAYKGKLTINLLLKYDISKKYQLKDVFFETAKATLLPQSYVSLDRVYQTLAIKYTLVIEVGGHTDNVGDDAMNMDLSHRRAQAVRDYLISKGIEASRLIAKGYGETQPIATNETTEGRAQNRRTEVIILKE